MYLFISVSTHWPHRQMKPRLFGAFSLVHLEGLLLMLIWVQLNSMNCSWFNDDVSDWFMGFKRATAVNILTLVIAFFGIDAQVTAGTGVGGVLAFRTVHHNNHHVIILIIFNHYMLLLKTYIGDYSVLHNRWQIPQGRRDDKSGRYTKRDPWR